MGFPAYRQPKGLPFTPPTNISRLPVALLRTALVTRSPELVEQAIQDYQSGADAPVMLPQRLQWQHHKSDLQTDGSNRPMHKDAHSSIDSLLALGEHVSGVNTRIARVSHPQPTYEMAAAARDRSGEFPQPPQGPPDPVISRDVPAGGRKMMPPPNAFVTAFEVSAQRAGIQRASKTQRALFEVSQTQMRVNKPTGK